MKTIEEMAQKHSDNAFLYTKSVSYNSIRRRSCISAFLAGAAEGAKQERERILGMLKSRECDDRFDTLGGHETDNRDVLLWLEEKLKEKE